MKKITIGHRFAQLALLSATSLTGISAFADTDAMQKRIIGFQAEASKEVANDQMHATLYAEVNNSNPTKLAQQINQIVNQAMQQAKRFPQVEVTTGSQNTQPIYDDKQRLKSWRGHAQINIKSTDFKAASDLISTLQSSSLQLQSMQFSISDQLRKKVENELIADATKDFQQRATIAQRSWNAKGYSLVNINYSMGSQFRPMAMYSKSRGMSASDAIESQNVEAGNSVLKVDAQGTIQLQ